MSETAPESGDSMASEAATAETTEVSLARALYELCKPSITAMNLLMALGGLAFAQHAVAEAEPVTSRLLLLLTIGSTLVVSSANAMNQVLEREGDALMVRTASRPLPSGHISLRAATTFGLVLGVVSIFLLAAINLLTAGIAVTAWLIYVLLYTPLKRHAPISLTVGAVAGAATPLMGWTAVTGSVGLGGALLFAILAVWQLPHFLAISLFRNDDYVRAGICTVPAVRGARVAKAQAVAWCCFLLPLSLALVWQDLAGPLYGITAAALGIWFLASSLQGLSKSAQQPWAKRFFFVSLAYLPLLTLALCLDVALL